MASDNQAVPSTYACRCLNIRITPAVSSSERPHYPSDPNYSSVFVNDEGIQVNHPQATVRLMSKPAPVPGTSRHSQFTALTCLFCALPVYRVHHTISLDIEGNSTAFLPSEEWVEKGILKSGTGWIDIHKDCFTRGDVAQALAAPSYVSLFAMTLPGTLPFPSSPELNGGTGSSPPEVKEKENDTTHLPEMSPVFLPPPFTPSNQVFIHLADVANQHSQSLRSEAEERIRNFVKAEVSEILGREKIIKRQVLCFWKEFKQHLGDLQLDTNRRNARSPTRLGDHSGTASSAVRSFSPTPLLVSTSLRHAMSPPQPRISALSASLATSTFHYPKESRRRSLEIERMSPGSSDDQTPDSRSVSSTLVQSTTSHGEEANVLQFRRTINDDINTQASYRYFVNLEEDMERFKRAREIESSKGRNDNTDQNESVVRSASSKPPDEVDTQTTEATTSETKEPQNETSPPRGRDKGKRKVTFDVKPAVVAIEKDKIVVAPDQEAIFRLDDMTSEEGAEVSTEITQNTLPLLEQPPPRPINIKRRSLNVASEAFHSLRPDSLPPPSHIRPLRSPQGVDSSHGMLTPLAKAPSPTKAAPKVTRPASPLSESEKELLKLVAADTPSHRGAWTPGSDNWNMITGKSSQDSIEETIEEDEEDEDGTAQSTPVAFPSRTLSTNKIEVLDLYNNMVGSLPVKIKKTEPPKPLSLASYVGQDATPEPVAPSTVDGKKQSTSSIRKAVYLEKDRARGIDPGPLDLVMEDDEIEDDGVTADGQEEGEKARLQALRILQARSELPEEGMWRSLA